MTVFISYAREDHKHILPVLNELRDHGFDLWIDEEGIEGAAFWRKEIVEAIETSSVILFFATEESCKSDAVFKELALANEENKPILPVLLKAIKLPSDLRYQVAGIQNIDLSIDWDRGIRSIIASLSRITNTEINKTTEVSPLSSEKFQKHDRLSNRFKGNFSVLAVLALSLTSYFYIFHNSPKISQEQPQHTTIIEQEDIKNSQGTRSIEEASIEKYTSKPVVPSEPIALRALVIGNGKYESGPALQNTVNDAKDVTDLLRSLGFQVTELIDLPRDKLLRNIRKHYASLSITRGLSTIRASIYDRVVHMVYYSGHSIEISGIQYIVPIDADFSHVKNYKLQLISIKDVMPDRYGIDVENNFTLYSTEPGGLAMDGDRSNSPFTRALLEGLKKPDLDLFGVFTYVRQSVKSSTEGRQIPWIAASADQPLWLSDVEKRNINGGASIIILDGCRDNPFKTGLNLRQD